MLESLFAYAEKRLELEKPQKDGTPLRVHLEKIEEKTGKTPKEMELPEFPDAAENAWDSWQELSESRPPGFSGPSAITYLEIEAYIRMTGTTLTYWEVDAIKMIDRIYRRVLSS